MTALHGNYGFDVTNKYWPFTDPEKVAYRTTGLTPDTILDNRDMIAVFCEACRHLLGAACVRDEFFNDAWEIAVGCIFANWPHFPKENFPPADSTIETRRTWIHNEVSEALLVKEMYERKLRETTNF